MKIKEVQDLIEREYYDLVKELEQIKPELVKIKSGEAQAAHRAAKILRQIHLDSQKLRLRINNDYLPLRKKLRTKKYFY